MQYKGIARQIVAIVLGVILTATMIFSMAPSFAHGRPGGSSTSLHADDPSTAAFYRTASAAAIYTDIMATWTGSVPDIKNMGTAAGGLGFIDKDYDLTGANHSLSSLDAQNNARYTYSSLSSVKGAQEYARFGFMAQYLGLDSTSTTASTQPERAILGTVVQGLYWVSSVIGNLVKMILQLLVYLNPFQLIANITNNFGDALGIGLSDGVTTNASSLFEAGAKGGLGKGFANTGIGEAFDIIGNIGRYLAIPLFIGVTVFGVLWTAVFRRQGFGGAGGKFRNLATRTIFILVGVALMGTLYTSVLNQALESALGGYGYGAIGDRAILSTFVNTKGWAEHNFSMSGLDVGSVGTSNGITPSVSAVNNLRSNAAKVNKISGIVSGDVSTSGNNPFYMNLNGAGDSGSHDAASNLVSSFVSGQMFTSADYQNYVNSKVKNRVSLVKWMAITADPENYGSNIASVGLGGDKEKINIKSNQFFSKSSVQGASARTVSAQQSLMDMLNNADLDNMSSKQIQDMLQAARTKAQGGLDSKSDMNYLSDGTATKLSTVGTYNYLNTKFDSSGFSVYSAKESTNNFTRISHYTTSVVGPDVFGRVVTLLNLVALLGAFTIVGIAYMFGMLFNNLRRGIMVIAQLPFATLGSLRSIAQVLMLTFMMCIELVCGLVMYNVAMSLIFGVNEFLVNGAGLGTLASQLGLQSNTIMSSTILGLVSSMLLLAVIGLALRLRGMFTSAMGDATSKMLESFVLGQGPSATAISDSTSNAASTAGKAALTGAAMLAMNGGAAGALGGAAKLAAGAAGVAAATGGLGGLAHATADAGAAQLSGGSSTADATASGAGGQGGSSLGSSGSAFLSTRDADAQAIGGQGHASASGQGGLGGSGEGGLGASASSQGGLGASASGQGGTGGVAKSVQAMGASVSDSVTGGATTTAVHGVSGSTSAQASSVGGSAQSAGYGASVHGGSGSTSAQASSVGGSAQSAGYGSANALGGAGKAVGGSGMAVGGASSVAASVHGVSAAQGATATASASGRAEGKYGSSGATQVSIGDVKATGGRDSMVAGTGAHADVTAVGGQSRYHGVSAASFSQGAAGAAGNATATGSAAFASGTAGQGGHGVGGQGSAYGAAGLSGSGYGTAGASGSGFGAAGASGYGVGSSVAARNAAHSTANGARVHGVSGSMTAAGKQSTSVRSDGTGRSGLETTRLAGGPSGSSRGMPSVASSSVDRQRQAREKARKAREAQRRGVSGTHSSSNRPSVAASSAHQATRNISSLESSRTDDIKRV